MTPALVQRLLRRKAEVEADEKQTNDWRAGVVAASLSNLMVALAGAKRGGRTFEPRDFFGDLPRLSDLRVKMPERMSPEEQVEFLKRWRAFFRAEPAIEA